VFNLDDEEYTDDSVEEVLEELEDGYEDGDHAASVMGQALQRIEEANLFRTLINSTIFSPNSARPEILAAVNKKIRNFATKELELLLGMRSPEVPRAGLTPGEAQELKALKDLFSESDVKILKMLIANVQRKNPDIAPAIQERKPEIVQIQAEPQPYEVQKYEAPRVQQKKVKLKPKPQPQKQMQKDAKQPSRQTVGKGPRPPTRQPTFNEKMNLLSRSVPGVHSSSEGLDAKSQHKSALSVGQLINQMTGGQVVDVDNSNPADKG